jgi:hypothetical protein
VSPNSGRQSRASGPGGGEVPTRLGRGQLLGPDRVAQGKRAGSGSSPGRRPGILGGCETRPVGRSLSQEIVPLRPRRPVPAAEALAVASNHAADPGLPEQVRGLLAETTDDLRGHCSTHRSLSPASRVDRSGRCWGSP